MLKCKKCGKELPDGTVFCDVCGGRAVDITSALSDFREDAAGGIDMVFVKGGTFTMGANVFKDGPEHSVTLSDFCIGKSTVTQKQWTAVMGYNPSKKGVGDDFPVNMVTWNDAQVFITKLNLSTGKKYRLPTEAEWEYAARGGAVSKGYDYSGSHHVDDVAWYSEGFFSFQRLHTVCGKKPNELGIYDMSGNVFEWVNDWYGEYTSNPQTDPQGPSSGPGHVCRGGSYIHEAKLCYVFRHVHHPNDNPEFHIGFRLALSP